MYGTERYRTEPSKIYLWKESPTGYILHREFDGETGISNLLISPNGESIFMFGNRAIQLWRTVDPTASSSRKQSHERFIVEFSPDGTLAAVTQVGDKAITVLDVKSGDSLLTIDAGMEVYGQRVTGSTVVVVNHENVVTWNLPARDRVLNTKANVNDSIQTATTTCPKIRSDSPMKFASISPDLHSIAIVEYTSPSFYLHLHDVPTGRCLGSVVMRGKGYGHPWFTSDRRQVWYITDPGVANGLTFIEDSKFGIKPKRLGPTNQPPGIPPWLPSRGYQITDDGWILGSSGKRLLRLPPHWRSPDTTGRTWSGRCLALLHGTLPEAVILELEE
ncbi:hypothetical protein BDM02DRAFT_3119638 [Thelephora ganbajun]|uniref:Uncharacterized protein n=1 Tax=Thelephora ganbajun TaxID=370292 RepID=A0ACB6Z8J9_THEGA|nr:hypothetical protein BDM02DRAFT_3119638 [Thelephora ganbajun]